MAKAIALIASTLCIVAVAAITPAFASMPEYMDIVGRVYCDTCQVQFPTKLSKKIDGASVALICRDPVTQEKRYEKSGRTNSSGLYIIHPDGDHTNDICEVTLKESPDENCREATPILNTVRVNLAPDDGTHQNVQYVYPLGFMAKKALPGCKKVLDDMGFAPIGN